MVGAFAMVQSPDGLEFGMPECDRCGNVYIIGVLRDTAVTPTTVFGDLQMDRSLLDAN
jgi:hypothetical protein